MNSFKRNLLTALFSLSAAFGMQTANASATAQATIDWSSFNVQIVDLSGGLNTPVFNWLSQEGSAYSYAVDRSPFDIQESIPPVANDFNTPSSANATTAWTQSSGLRDAHHLQANSAASGSVDSPIDTSGYGIASASNTGAFEVTGKGFALFTVDWDLTTTGGSGDVGNNNDNGHAQAIFSGFLNDSILDSFLYEEINTWDSVTNRKGTFGWAVYSDGVRKVTGTLGFEVFANSGVRSVIPVPGAIWLFGSVLMGWLEFSRRKPSFSRSA